MIRFSMQASIPSAALSVHVYSQEHMDFRIRFQVMAAVLSGAAGSAPKSLQTIRPNSYIFFGREGRSRAADGALCGYDAVAAGIFP